MDLDLGSKVTCNVKVDGAEYKISAPTVLQTEKYQKELNKVENDGQSVGAFIDFLEQLGMPRNVSQNLDVVQLRKLSEGLLGLVEKK